MLWEKHPLFIIDNHRIKKKRKESIRNDVRVRQGVKKEKCLCTGIFPVLSLISFIRTWKHLKSWKKYLDKHLVVDYLVRYSNSLMHEFYVLQRLRKVI